MDARVEQSALSALHQRFGDHNPDPRAEVLAQLLASRRSLLAEICANRIKSIRSRLGVFIPLLGNVLASEDKINVVFEDAKNHDVVVVHIPTGKKKK